MDKDDKKNNKINLKADDENKKLKEEIDKQKKEAEEYKNKYLRALADYRNFENRIQGQNQDLIKKANKELIIKLLPYLDNLDKAEIFIKDKALNLIKNNFCKILQNEGIKEINILGQEFDPYLAEVIDIIEGEKDNVVVEILRKGYKFHDQIIRPAQVKVSKRKIVNH